MDKIEMKPCPFCDCKEYRDRYEKLEGDELERTFCSEIRGTRYCKYEELH